MKRVFAAVSVLVLFTFGLGLAAPTEREPTVMEEVAGVVDSVKREFPAIRDSTVETGDLAPNVYAVTRATVGGTHFLGRITVNTFFASDRQRMQASTEHDVKLGFHPPLGHCTAAQFIAFHEAAHLVDASEDGAAHNALFNRFGHGHQLHGILSGYSFYREGVAWVGGMLNMPEALAEAFAAVHCSGGNPTERALSKMLTDLGETREVAYSARALRNADGRPIDAIMVRLPAEA